MDDILTQEMTELKAQQTILEAMLENEAVGDDILTDVINRTLVKIYLRTHELEREIYAA